MLKLRSSSRSYFMMDVAIYIVISNDSEKIGIQGNEISTFCRNDTICTVHFTKGSRFTPSQANTFLPKGLGFLNITNKQPLNFIFQHLTNSASVPAPI